MFGGDKAFTRFNIIYIMRNIVLHIHGQSPADFNLTLSLKPQPMAILVIFIFTRCMDVTPLGGFA